MSERDHYEVLGLSSTADGTAVNRTYWQLARKYQALAPSDPRAHGMLDELNEAYNVLGTPALRDAYDANRSDCDDPRADEREQSVGAKSARSWRAPKAAGSQEPGTSSSTAALKSWMVYGCGAALTAAGAAAGFATGNLILDALAGGGAVAIGVAAARQAPFGARRGRKGSPSPVEAPAPSQSAAQARRRPAAEPLSASIVRNRSASADEVRTSTASMVGRWRTKANATPKPDAAEPDHTLVDIFRSEQEIETQSEPLTAVLDVLRGSRKPVESR